MVNRLKLPATNFLFKRILSSAIKIKAIPDQTCRSRAIVILIVSFPKHRMNKGMDVAAVTANVVRHKTVKT